MPQGGCRPDRVVDVIRERGWPTVLGNSDALLFDIHDGLIALPPRMQYAEPAAQWSPQKLDAERDAIRRSGMPDYERVLRLIERPGPWPVRSASGPETAVRLPWSSPSQFRV